METIITMFASFVGFCGGVILITETVNKVFKVEGVTELTMENATELVQRAGLTLRAKAECEPAMGVLLDQSKSGLTLPECFRKFRARIVLIDNQPINH